MGSSDRRKKVASRQIPGLNYLKTKCNPKYNCKKTKDKHLPRHIPYFWNNADLRILNLKLRNRGFCKYKCVDRNQAKNLGKVSFLSVFKSFYPTKNTRLDSPTCFLSHLRSVWPPITVPTRHLLFLKVSWNALFPKCEPHWVPRLTLDTKPAPRFSIIECHQKCGENPKVKHQLFLTFARVRQIMSTTV